MNELTILAAVNCALSTAALAFLLRLENRLTRLETLVEILRGRRGGV